MRPETQQPECDADYPTRWRLIKRFFTSHLAGAGDMPVPGSRQIKGERGVWQRRYWDSPDWGSVEGFEVSPVVGME